jgi:hypothetical protein
MLGDNVTTRMASGSARDDVQFHEQDLQREGKSREEYKVEGQQNPIIVASMQTVLTFGETD